MRNVLVLLTSVVLLSGCVSAGTTYQDGMRVRTIGETNLLRPSLSVMEVSVCVHDEHANTTYTDVLDGEAQSCHGEYVPMATVQGTQSGALTGLGGAMIQGGAIVGGAYLLGDGIRDSASQVNQNGGGANSNSEAKAKSRSSSKSSSKQYQSQYQRQSQRQTQPMPMMGGGD